VGVEAVAALGENCPAERDYLALGSAAHINLYSNLSFDISVIQCFMGFEL
jgi:hypothetical protein